MKGVPGVMVLLSQVSPFSGSGIRTPCRNDESARQVTLLAASCWAKFLRRTPPLWRLRLATRRAVQASDHNTPSCGH